MNSKSEDSKTAVGKMSSSVAAAFLSQATRIAEAAIKKDKKKAKEKRKKRSTTTQK